jgi:hypothetical protein
MTYCAGARNTILDGGERAGVWLGEFLVFYINDLLSLGAVSVHQSG